MLKKLTTKSFRKLTDHTFEFGPGLQIVRGENEAGKSTMLEAIGYLIGGTGALRDAIDDVVTWGQPTKNLEVQGWFTIQGVEYFAKRSKRGAEVTYGDQRVVGQKEVTASFARLFGAEPEIAAKLMIASQGQIRGALAEPKGKAVELIEKLANFDIIDYIVELVQANRVTGPTTSAEDRVKRCEEQVAAAKAGVVEPNLHEYGSMLGMNRDELLQVQAAVDVLKPQVDAGQARLNICSASKQRRDAVKLQVARMLDQNAERQRDLAIAEDAAAHAPAPIELVALDRELADAEQKGARLLAHQQVKHLMDAYPEVYWDEGLAKFEEAHAAATAAVSKLAIDFAAAAAQVKALRGQLQTGGTNCKACGQALPNAAALEKHNKEVREALALEEGFVEKYRAELEAARAELAALEAVKKSAERYDRTAWQYQEVVEVDDSFVPPKLKWIGPAPEAFRATSEIKADIERYKKRLTAAQLAAARAEVLDKAIAQAGDEIHRLEEEMVECVTDEALANEQRQFDEANEQYQTAYSRASTLRFEIERLNGLIATARQIYDQQMRRVAEAEQELQRAQKDLNQLEFNNALVKRIRTARPIVADKLWSIVLPAVSSYFSAMRGQKSVITRAGNEFLCDGKAVSGGTGNASGSALDCLGLALRIAMTKTFLPNAAMLILDEPTAAADDNRTQSMLGFITAAGFDQTLMVTHDEDSESVAQNLITI